MSTNLGNGPNGSPVIGFDSAYSFPAARAVSNATGAYIDANPPGVSYVSEPVSFEIVFKAQGSLPQANEYAVLFEVRLGGLSRISKTYL